MKPVTRLLMIARKFGMVDAYMRISIRVTEGVGGRLDRIIGTSAT